MSCYFLGDTIPHIQLLSFSSKEKKERVSNKSAKKVTKATEKLITKSSKEFDIAKSRGVELKELLQYDHLRGNTLFEGDELKKHNKTEILHCGLHVSY